MSQCKLGMKRSWIWLALSSFYSVLCQVFSLSLSVLLDLWFDNLLRSFLCNPLHFQEKLKTRAFSSFWYSRSSDILNYSLGICSFCMISICIYFSMPWVLLLHYCLCVFPVVRLRLWMNLSQEVWSQFLKRGRIAWITQRYIRPFDSIDFCKFCLIHAVFNYKLTSMAGQEVTSSCFWFVFQLISTKWNCQRNLKLIKGNILT